jgi:hypothetical protein
MTMRVHKFREFFFRWLPLNELILCFVALFVFNNYIKHSEQVIRADGLGYYNYLPALFIYEDLNFNFTDTLQTEFYNHQEANRGIIQQVNGKGVNKYFVGTAVMQSPFFLVAHLIAKNNGEYKADGYSKIYQRSIYHASLVWALIGLLFIRLTLSHLGVNRWWIFWIQASVFLASSLPNYIVNDASFSHAYSFALVSIWTYLIISFKPEKALKLLWIGLVLGLIVLIRPVNILLILFLPFLLVISGKKLSDIKIFFLNRKVLLLSFLIFGLVVSIQALVWYLQTGQWIVRSYGNESFNFADPHIIDFLFSYRKGFFVYAPIFFVFLILGIGIWAIKKSWLKIALFILPVLVLVYVLSSWWVWYYGESFGSRVMIDFYPMILLFAVPIYDLKGRIIKWLTIPLIAFFSFMALVQTYQYKNYILLGDAMHKSAYWTVFLKTDEKYQGYLWQEKFDSDWTKDELLRITDIPLHFLFSEPLIQNFEVSKAYSRLVVVIKGNCSYSDGTNRFMIAIDDSLRDNHRYLEKAIFKSNAKENFSGSFQLPFFFDPLELNRYTLVCLIYKEEEMNCAEPFEIIVYGLH